MPLVEKLEGVSDPSEGRALVDPAEPPSPAHRRPPPAPAARRMAGGEAEPLLGWRGGGGPALRGGPRGAAGLAAVVLAVLVADANRGLLIPSLQPYLGRFGGSTFEVGACNAAFSLGRLLAAPLYGLWMDRRSPGEPLLAALGLAGLANLLYTYAGPLGGGAPAQSRRGSPAAACAEWVPPCLVWAEATLASRLPGRPGHPILLFSAPPSTRASP